MRHDHLLSAGQLDRADIEGLLDRAARIAADPETVRDRLTDRLLALCFFEPRTRTKLSFVAATQRLGGDVIAMWTVGR